MANLNTLMLIDIKVFRFCTVIYFKIDIFLLFFSKIICWTVIYDTSNLHFGSGIQLYIDR